MTPFVATLIWILIASICGIIYFARKCFGDQFSFGAGIALLASTLVAGGCMAILICGFLILFVSRGGM